MAVELMECIKCHKYYLIVCPEPWDPMLPWLCNECIQRIRNGEFGEPLGFWFGKREPDR